MARAMNRVTTERKLQEYFCVSPSTIIEGPFRSREDAREFIECEVGKPENADIYEAFGQYAVVLWPDDED